MLAKYFCGDIQSGRWQSLGKAELQTHLLGSGELGSRSGAVGATRSCLRTFSVCGFET